MTEYQPTPPPATPYGTGPAAPRTAVLSILSLVFGIIGLLTGWFFVGFLPAVAGVVLGVLARKREPQAKGMWLTGIITGALGILTTVVVVILYVVALAFVANNGGLPSTAP